MQLLIWDNFMTAHEKIPQDIETIQRRVLASVLYQKGERFTAATMATRLGQSTYHVNRACRALSESNKMSRYVTGGINENVTYGKPLYNKWLTIKWTDCEPPPLRADELTPSTRFIKGNPLYD